MRVILGRSAAHLTGSPSIPGAGRRRSARAGRAGSKLLVKAVTSRRRMRPGVVRAVAQRLLDQADIAVLSAIDPLPAFDRMAHQGDGSRSSQDALIAFLSEGRSFGMPDAAVERITTHAAIVFLVGERAYKMKRAVRYSFLDFTTFDRRKRALESELELNRRTAPMLYLRLVPVTRGTDGALALAGSGKTVEWLLEMVRFDQEARLDRARSAASSRLRSSTSWRPRSPRFMTGRPRVPNMAAMPGCRR